MRCNQCHNCKHGIAMHNTVHELFVRYDRFYVECEKFGRTEITPCLRDFIATCGCASWEMGEV